MALGVLKRLAPAVLALGVAGSGLGFGGMATAWASTTAHAEHSAVARHATKSKTAAKPKPAPKAAVKAGAPCTKAELGKSAKSGKVTLVCKKSGKTDKWVAQAPAKKVVKKKK